MCTAKKNIIANALTDDRYIKKNKTTQKFRRLSFLLFEVVQQSATCEYRNTFALRICSRLPFFQGKNCLLPVGDYAIKPYIPSIWRNFLDFLTMKCDTKQLWSYPVCPVPQV